MSRIRSINTTPELLVRSLVYRLGYRFPGRKKVIFVHGCFWHGHENCPKGKLPKSNLEMWEPKILRNQARDATTIKEVKSEGWKVMTIWQCELKNKNIDKVQKKIVRFLEK
jgi:DNA mismatch endonuclease (patch repair protein)